MMIKINYIMTCATTTSFCFYYLFGRFKWQRSKRSGCRSFAYTRMTTVQVLSLLPVLCLYEVILEILLFSLSQAATLSCTFEVNGKIAIYHNKNRFTSAEMIIRKLLAILGWIDTSHSSYLASCWPVDWSHWLKRKWYIFTWCIIVKQ